MTGFIENHPWGFFWLVVIFLLLLDNWIISTINAWPKNKKLDKFAQMAEDEKYQKIAANLYNLFENDKPKND